MPSDGGYAAVRRYSAVRDASLLVRCTEAVRRCRCAPLLAARDASLLVRCTEAVRRCRCAPVKARPRLVGGWCLRADPNALLRK